MGRPNDATEGDDARQIALNRNKPEIDPAQELLSGYLGKKNNARTN
jgi:hypothetical protein